MLSKLAAPESVLTSLHRHHIVDPIMLADLGGTTGAVVTLQPGSSLTFIALTLVNAMPLDEGVGESCKSLTCTCAASASLRPCAFCP
jgi:hypothetical protein